MIIFYNEKKVAISKCMSLSQLRFEQRMHKSTLKNTQEPRLCNSTLEQCCKTLCRDLVRVALSQV